MVTLLSLSLRFRYTTSIRSLSTIIEGFHAAAKIEIGSAMSMRRYLRQRHASSVLRTYHGSDWHEQYDHELVKAKSYLVEAYVYIPLRFQYGGLSAPGDRSREVCAKK